MTIRRRKRTTSNSEGVVRTDPATGRQYLVVTGALPDQPLGELPDDAAREQAMREAAQPRRVFIE